MIPIELELLGAVQYLRSLVAKRAASADRRSDRDDGRDNPQPPGATDTGTNRRPTGIKDDDTFFLVLG